MPCRVCSAEGRSSASSTAGIIVASVESSVATPAPASAGCCRNSRLSRCAFVSPATTNYLIRTAPGQSLGNQRVTMVTRILPVAMATRKLLEKIHPILTARLRMKNPRSKQCFTEAMVHNEEAKEFATVGHLVCRLNLPFYAVLDCRFPVLYRT